MLLILKYNGLFFTLRVDVFVAFPFSKLFPLSFALSLQGVSTN